MSNGLAVQLPLIEDSVDGFYLLIKDYPSLSVQNLKMLLLTNPGERVMDPAFGVGLRRYLFEPNSRYTFSVMRGDIETQVQKYLPFLDIEDVQVIKGTPAGDGLSARVQVFYKIIPLQFQGVLQIDVSNN
jgi:hypothetical protein